MAKRVSLQMGKKISSCIIEMKEGGNEKRGYFSRFYYS
jgi:hypothetical protein